jgi:TRAP-type C4-dicarboxylate transport system permease small subunit
VEIFRKVVHAANNSVLKIALLLMLLMMFATVADITGRWFFRPIPGIFELTRYSLAIIVFASLGYAQIHKAHIAIEIFFSRFPALMQRIVEVIIYFTAVIAFSIGFWQMLVYAGRLYNNGLITTVLRLPVYPWVYVSAIALLCFNLALLVDLLDAIRRLIKGGEKE